MLRSILLLVLFLCCTIAIQSIWKRKSKDKSIILVVLGSGGHTGEMFDLLENMQLQSNQDMVFIVAKSDKSSLERLKHKERYTESHVRFIKRAKNVGQSNLSSIPSTLYAIVESLYHVFTLAPSIILVNGPGTCVPVAIAGYFMRIIGIVSCKIVFVESFCRVRTLSLTGKILSKFVDYVIVPWPELQTINSKFKYLGQLF